MLICGSNLFSQETGTIRMTAMNYPTAHPLVLVNGLETDMESMVLAPDHIESISILKDKASKEQYGEKAKDGIILITTKPGIEFYQLDHFVDSSKNLNRSVSKIELNGKLLVDRNKLLIEKSALTSTMISADFKIDNNCNLSSTDTLVISTRFADGKE